MSGVKQPKWYKPAAIAVPKLHINNSLTKKKEEFIPKNGNQVSFYICGPTVYDRTHLGHGRTFLTFDIIRRTMEDYFGYNVLFIMNITDIDDKIIINSRQNHLFLEFQNENQKEILPVQTALDFYKNQKFKKFGYEPDLDWSEFLAKAAKIPAEEEPKLKLFIKTAEQTMKQIEQYSTSKTIDYQLVKDVLSNWLDHEKGHLVTDQKISKEFASFWENDFFIDMDSLKIKRPDILTRVSEYVPEIIEFCNQIIKNGYAYEVNGSVYFDIAKFSADGHDYAKLAPWSAGNMKLVQEGEGDLTSETTQKKNDSDFALWKNSKAGEPFWDSPWGKGRPGWHIECSVMAGAIVGDGMDIHGGGIDLQFPHHDNELAQSEAHYKCHQWVNYFMHTGHLHVENMKMSKSLKNFLPIKVNIINPGVFENY
jgi:cysteinyl-tRNA synthetase